MQEHPDPSARIIIDMMRREESDHLADEFHLLISLFFFPVARVAIKLLFNNACGRLTGQTLLEAVDPGRPVNML